MYIGRSSTDKGYPFGTFGDTMLYFNLCYYGFVGVLMYNESYGIINYPWSWLDLCKNLILKSVYIQLYKILFNEEFTGRC